MNMKWERLILIAFLGNYLINTVVSAIVALIPGGNSASLANAQYVTFVILAMIAAALIAWWYFAPLSRMNAFTWGMYFGLGAFVISILTTFISGFAGVVVQSGSLSQAFGIIPNFGPYLAHLTTLWLLIYWFVPSALVGYWLQMRARRAVHSPNNA